MRLRPVLSTLVICIALLANAAIANAVTKPNPSSVATQAPLICIDPGHGGPFSNANANGLRERTINLQIGLALRDTLVSRGYRVIMTRTTNTALVTTDTETWNLKNSTTWDYAKDHLRYYQESIPKDDLTARTRVANRAGADLFVSIHCNGAARHSAKGTETWASPRDALGKQLAGIVQSAVIARTKRVNRGSHSTDFYVLRWANMPAILVESAFITNSSDAAFLKSSLGRSKVASGVADGVDMWFARTPFRATIPRISAATAPELAVALSRLDFPLGTANVVVVRSDRATDTPGAAALAARLGAALLLSDGPTPDATTVAEIARLRPTQVLIVGLEGSLDAQGLTRALAGAGASGSLVVPVKSADRASLAARIAELMGAPGGGRVILVHESDDAAQMAVAPIAAATGNPILLTGDTTLGAATYYLASQVGVVSKVLSVGTKHRPAPYAGAGTGRTLYYTDSSRMQRILNEETFPAGATGSLKPVIANSQVPGDVLTVSLHAARVVQPAVLLAGPSMSPYTRLYLTNKRPQTKSFLILDSGAGLPPLVDALLKKTDS